MLELEIHTQNGGKRTVRLEGEPLSIGRAHDNELSYPNDASLSRKHAAIERSGESWVVRDLKSKNGTFVNGARIAEGHTLRAGDRVEAGQLVMICGKPKEDSSGVVFTPDLDSPLHATVMTSLEQVFSSKEAKPPVPASFGSSLGGALRFSFDHPAVNALIRAGKELSARQPLPELFHLILELSLQAVGAERGALLTVEGDNLVVQAMRGEALKISTVVRDRVLQQKVSVLVRDTQIDDAFKWRESVHGQQIRSMMAVPLQTEDRVIGLVYVDSRYFVRELTPDDLNLLTVIANVAAVRIEHRRLADVEQMERILERDLEQAAVIQRGLLPERAPSVPGLDLAGYNAPCRTVGGDYYDFFPYPDGSVAVVLGDVAGKGMPAALGMSSLQARVHVLCEDTRDLAEMMSRLDRSIARNCPGNRFVSLFFCVIDPAAATMRYCNAGHNPPLLIHAPGGAASGTAGASRIDRLEGSGTILGLLPDLGYDERQCRFEPGDLVALFSDGVTEAVNPEGEEFGEERLGEILRSRRQDPASSVVEAVMEAVSDWTEEAPAADDITLVVARRIG